MPQVHGQGLDTRTPVNQECVRFPFGAVKKPKIFAIIFMVQALSTIFAS